MTDRLALPRRYRDQLEALLREHVPGVEVWAYGSRGNGESHDGSDLDLVLRSTTLEPLGDGYLDLIYALEQSSIPILVQAHDWARLPESFHREIEREYVVVERVASEPMGTMEDGWAEIPFSEAVEINPSVPLDRGVVYTFVDMASVNAETRSVKSVQEREFQGGGSRFQDGDTLRARITPCLENGKIARYQSSGTQKDAHGSTEFIVIRGRPDLTDNDFAYYLTQWKEVRNYAIGQMTGTSGRQRVPMDSLDHLTVPLPPVSEQRAIAHILGTLDDKIELNRRMNQTLEEMARAIFQDWFVDFGPVRAKLEGREPYLPPELWDLFPDRLVDSELGEVPEGWGIRSIEDISERVAMGPFGSSIKVSTFVDSGIPVISGQHLTGTLLEDGDYRFITEDHADKLANANVRRGDIVFTHAGSIGQAAYIPETSQYDRYVISQRQFYMRCDTSKISPLFVVHFFKTQEGQHQLLANTSSTGVPSIARPVTYLRSIALCLPPKALWSVFHKMVGGFHRTVAQNDKESLTLAIHRDTLLPKLVSGEWRVGEIVP